MAVDGPQALQASVLVVDPEPRDVMWLASMLIEAGFRVQVARSFHDAKTMLTTSPPALLVTELRLGAFNGLQLVLRGRRMHPTMAALVTSSVADPVLQLEAERLGATLVIKPFATKEFQAALRRVLLPAVEPDGSGP